MQKPHDLSYDFISSMQEASERLTKNMPQEIIPYTIRWCLLNMKGFSLWYITMLSREHGSKYKIIQVLAFIKDNNGDTRH